MVNNVLLGGDSTMKKYFSALLVIVIVTLCYLIMASASIVYNDEYLIPKPYKDSNDKYRLVLITKDVDTAFWKKVGDGAVRQASEEGASLEIWGSYSNNTEEFLEKLELAIHAKVDGIIIQGLDTEEFKELTRVKASFDGIPIITIANDVPMKESLRRTYVGSNQYQAGQLIARELIHGMGTSGKVVLLYDSEQEYYQSERLAGINEILKNYPNIQVSQAATSQSRDQVVNTVRDQLNKAPDLKAFISVNSNMIGPMVDEIEMRYQVEPYYLYTFDDGAESLPLLEEGKIDGVVEQDPEKMGEISIQQLVKWLDGGNEPLDINGYFTGIRILKDEKND